MPTTASRLWDFLSQNGFGQVIWAAFLPVWVLLAASTIHGPPSVSTITVPLMSGVALGGGLVAAGVGIWFSMNRNRLPTVVNAAVQQQPDQTLLQRAAGLMGGAAFLASVFQLATDFSIFSNFLQTQSWSANAELTPWDTMFILATAQFVFFFVEAKLRRN